MRVQKRSAAKDTKIFQQICVAKSLKGFNSYFPNINAVTVALLPCVAAQEGKEGENIRQVEKFEVPCQRPMARSPQTQNPRRISSYF